jgi:hypothetical protein
MQTYKYNADSKEYLYAEEAFLDPLETEAAGKPVYLLPADSTFTPPPLEPKPGHAVRWSGKEWEHVEDHRQKQDRNGEHPTGQGTPYWMPKDTWQTPARYMMELGKLPEGAMLKAPEKPAEVVAEEELAKAKAERAAAVAALTVEVDGMVFDGDEKAQERMARAVLMAESPEESMEWVLADSSVAVVTAEQLRRACRAAGKAQGALWVVPYR